MAASFVLCVSVGSGVKGAVVGVSEETLDEPHERGFHDDLCRVAGMAVVDRNRGRRGILALEN
jgi:hypothetical protein